jgi:hypothetical protein
MTVSKCRSDEKPPRFRFSSIVASQAALEAGGRSEAVAMAPVLLRLRRGTCTIQAAHDDPGTN